MALRPIYPIPQGAARVAPARVVTPPLRAAVTTPVTVNATQGEAVAVGKTVNRTVGVSQGTGVTVANSVIRTPLTAVSQATAVTVRKQIAKTVSASALTAAAVSHIAAHIRTIAVAQAQAQAVVAGRIFRSTVNVTPAAPTGTLDSIISALSPQFSWPLEETSGTTATDVADSNNGTYQNAGGILYNQSGIGDGSASVHFGGSAFVSTSAQQTNPQVFSLAIAFKTTSTGGGGLFMFADTQTGAPSSNDRRVWLDPSGKLVFATFNGSAVYITSAGTYNDGNWHRVVATHGADGMHLYADGVLVGSDPNTSSTSYAGYWRIGAVVGAGWSDAPTAASGTFVGNLAKATIFSRVLNASDRAAFFGQGGSTVVDVQVGHPFSRSLAVSQAQTATVATVTAHARAVAAVQSAAVTLGRAVGRAVSVGQAQAVSRSVAVAAKRTVTQPTAATVAAARAFLRTVNITQAQTAVVAKTAAVARTASQATAVAVSRVAAHLRTITATAGSVVTSARAVAKTVSLTQAAVATVSGVKQTGTRVVSFTQATAASVSARVAYARSVTASQATTVATSRVLALLRTVTATQSTVVSRTAGISRRVNVTQTIATTAAAIKAFLRSASATQATAVTVSKQAQPHVTASQPQAVSAAKAVTVARAAIQPAVVSVAKIVARKITLTEVTARTIVASRAFLRTATATQATVATVKRQLGIVRTIAQPTTVATAINIARHVSSTQPATVTFSAVPTRLRAVSAIQPTAATAIGQAVKPRTATATVATNVTTSRATGRAVTATQSAVVTFRRSPTRTANVNQPQIVTIAPQLAPLITVRAIYGADRLTTWAAGHELALTATGGRDALVTHAFQPVAAWHSAMGAYGQAAYGGIVSVQPQP